MAEWSNAAVLKTVDLHGSGGSNPSLSAKETILFNRVVFFMPESEGFERRAGPGSNCSAIMSRIVIVASRERTNPSLSAKETILFLKGWFFYCLNIKS